MDTNNRLICYDILDLGKQLMPIGMLVVLDSILNRITQNRAKGRNTFIFIDEIYLLFQHEYSANFLFTLGSVCVNTALIEIYDDIKQKADKVVYTSQEYTRGCMHKRNRHLVDNSSACISYLTENKGGTFYTVNYAKSKGVEVINIAE